MKVVLCPNPDRDHGFSETVRAAELLRENGCAVSLCLPGTENDWPEEVGGLKPAPLLQEINGADLLITFGGDGTLLHLARAVVGHSVPILGINLGRMGFLTDLERSELPSILRAVRGEGVLDRRIMLDLVLKRNDDCIRRDYALNDIVVHGISRPIDVTVFTDERRVAGFSGDGLVISSPTGSTAYSMSAGGPVVDPQAENIILTPICVHELFARSFVMGPDKQVRVQVGDLSQKEAYLSIDGCDCFPLQTGDEITVKKSEHCVTLLRVSDRSFYDKLYAKLGGKT